MFIERSISFTMITETCGKKELVGLPCGKKYLHEIGFQSGAERKGKDERSGRAAVSFEKQRQQTEEDTLNGTGQAVCADIGADHAENDYDGPEHPEGNTGKLCPEASKPQTEEKQQNVSEQ